MIAVTSIVTRLDVDGCIRNGCGRMMVDSSRMFMRGVVTMRHRRGADYLADGQYFRSTGHHQREHERHNTSPHHGEYTPIAAEGRLIESSAPQPAFPPQRKPMKAPGGLITDTELGVIAALAEI